MNYKKTNAEVTTITRNLSELDKDTQNIYESIAILGKRANQINHMMREELNSKLEEFATSTDNLEEIFENREQIEISRFYERLPKPTQIATQELLEGKIYFRKPEVEVQPAAEDNADKA
ncbi:MAG: DNA-directed RNA polymerase subunit omega [Flavobacteriales bacterium]|nr:DNA-directed RNA polymerase subunit omega [Flavobacteriales bacterium]MCB9448015.1 DNA-directed RNA polymerase subunit omega [Flavobacteriales bacterium]